MEKLDKYAKKISRCSTKLKKLSDEMKKQPMSHITCKIYEDKLYDIISELIQVDDELGIKAFLKQPFPRGLC